MQDLWNNWQWFAKPKCIQTVDLCVLDLSAYMWDDTWRKMYCACATIKIGSSADSTATTERIFTVRFVGFVLRPQCAAPGQQPLALRVSVLLTVPIVLRHGPLVKSSILRRDFPENTFCCGFLGNKEELWRLSTQRRFSCASWNNFRQIAHKKRRELGSANTNWTSACGSPDKRAT